MPAAKQMQIEAAKDHDLLIEIRVIVERIEAGLAEVKNCQSQDNARLDKAINDISVSNTEITNLKTDTSRANTWNRWLSIIALVLALLATLIYTATAGTGIPNLPGITP